MMWLLFKMIEMIENITCHRNIKLLIIKYKNKNNITIIILD